MTGTITLGGKVSQEERVIDGYRVFPQGMIVLEVDPRWTYHQSPNCRCGEHYCCAIQRQKEKATKGPVHDMPE